MTARSGGWFFILVLVVVLGTPPARADGHDDLLFIMESRGLLPAGDVEGGRTNGGGSAEGFWESIPETVNELKLAAYVALRLYQLLISTQDASSCMFVPTCSRYAMAAIEKYGVFRGVLMASDRLQRCNGWGRDLYPLDPKTARLLDPP